ncbi:MAG: M48 family metallopeptidase [Planctomycetota bacterium]|nr:M48 family metallopeptidase [Planctomycetota bacterium]
MDFFEYQERARKRTGQLVVLYGLAVLGIIVLVYIAVVGLLVFAASRDPDAAQRDFWAPELLLWIGGGTLALVGITSLIKIRELASGGGVVAKALGGRLLNLGTRDKTERKVLNVVEEMSIASGVPVPAVYLLDRESGINAFAAGHKPEHAVIGITRGAAELLSRDELQGVVAHEFSHILNGDMRLNIRLISILHGILVIGLLGGTLMRIAFYTGRSSRRGGGAGGIIALGVALFVIGYIGVFFGRLIKAAVSRQREYLADASAVDFTRNPDGLSGALQKIGGAAGHARLRSPKAEEFSHMYFGQGIRTLWNAFATHPPLPGRIRRIDPRWDGTFAEVAAPQRVEEPSEAAAPDASVVAMPLATVLAATAVAQVGRPTQKHLDYARSLLDRIPDRLAQAAHESAGARALVYCLLLDPGEDVRARQWERLDRHAKEVADRARELAPLVEQCGPEARIPLLDLATPALRELTAMEYAAFKDDFEALAGADRRIDTFEWLLRHVILLYLEPHFTKATKPVVQYYNLQGIRRECAQLLSTLAREGNEDEEAAKRAFELGRARLKGVDPAAVPFLPPEECRLRDLDAALDKLATVTPRFKRPILEAAGACIAADKQVTVEEGEIFRGIADILGCPMPPLLPGQPLA